jgi:O-antigen ligase
VFVDPNYYGMFIATAIVVAANWILGTHDERVRWLLGFTMLVLVGGLIVSQSRSAFLALLIALVVGAFVRARALGILMAVAAAVIGLLLLPLLIELRLTNAGGAVTDLGLARTMASDAYRLDAVLHGPQLFLTSPVFGVGLGNYLLITGDASHNWYMVVLAEQGLLGIASLLLVLGLAALSLRGRPTLPRAVGYGVLAILTIGGFFLEPTIETQWSLPAAILVTAAVVCRWDPLTRRPARMTMGADRSASRA